MAELLVQMENVLNITSNGQAFSEALCTHVGNPAGENLPILLAPIDVWNLTMERCKEAMVVVQEDI